MRISKLWKDKLNSEDTKVYEFEYTGHLTLKIDGFEIVKDWLDPNLVLEIEHALEQALVDCIAQNRTPYFVFKETMPYPEFKIRKKIKLMAYNNKDKDKLLDACRRVSGLSDDEVLKIIRKIYPDF